MLSPKSINLGCTWNSVTRSLSRPDSYVLSSVQNATVKSDEGAKVKVGDRTYRVVFSNNQFKVSRESHSGCFSGLLERLGWPKGEISRSIELLLNKSPVNLANNNTASTNFFPELPPVDYSAHELPPIENYILPSVGQFIGKGGNAIVYEDASDKTKVLKMFTVPQTSEEVNMEVDCFNKYYGRGSASKIYNSKGEVLGIRMDRIQGKSLMDISLLPSNAEQAIYEMFGMLEQKGFFCRHYSYECFI